MGRRGGIYIGGIHMRGIHIGGFLERRGLRRGELFESAFSANSPRECSRIVVWKVGLQMCKNPV